MHESQEIDRLDLAVKALHKNKVVNANAWNDSFSEFKQYVEVRSKQPLFFRIFETPSNFRYSEDSHQRISTILSGLLINIEVSRFEQDFEKTSYLLKSECNYVTLRELIQIKKSNLEQADVNLMIHVLNHLKDLIPVLVAQGIEVDVSLNTVCFRDEKVRFCDYNIFFYPCNKRSSGDGLELIYLKKAACIIYSLLAHQKPADSYKISTSEATSLLLNLIERQPFKSNGLLMEVIRKLLLESIIEADRLRLLTQRMIYTSSLILTESNLSTKSSIMDNDLSQPFIKATSMASITSQTTAQKISGGRSNNKNVVRSICVGFCLLILLGGIGFYLYFFSNYSPLCKSNEYLNNKSCLPCATSCTRCTGQLKTMCTMCKASQWLVKQDIEEPVGSCENRCGGIQLDASRECIVRPSNSSN